MEFTVGERLRLLSILPEQGNLITIKVVRDLRGDLAMNEEEITSSGVKVVEGRIVWSDDAASKEIEIGPKGSELIEKALRELNEKDELTVSDLTLWEKFIGEI